MPPIPRIPITIRPKLPSDAPHIQTIELKAGQIFHSIAMSAIAEDAPPSLEEIDESLGWVFVLAREDETGEGVGGRVGYVLVELFENLAGLRERRNGGEDEAEDEAEDRGEGQNQTLNQETKNLKSVFIKQVSVLPPFTRHGIGKALVSHAESWAREQGCVGVDLSTFRDVPWNRPFYERLGFRVVGEEDLGGGGFEGLMGAVMRERGDGLLGRWERVGMRKVLG